jgi:hypothetical protein
MVMRMDNIANPKLSRFIKWILISAFFCIFVGVNAEAIDANHIYEKGRWTIMFYIDADNNLDRAAPSNINELEKVGSSKEINIIVQWDRSSRVPKSEMGNWTGTKRFHMLNKSSDELEDLGEVDMANTSQLADFINWTRERYPAERYALVMWDHGGGWKGHTTDDTSNDTATVDSLANALERTGFCKDNKLDLLVFDQCLMGQIDTIYAMAPYAKAMVASEDVIPWHGINHAEPLHALVENPSMDEKQLAKMIVDDYKIYYERKYPNQFVTLSAYDLDMMPVVFDAAKNFPSILRAHMENSWPKIGRTVIHSESFAKSVGLYAEVYYSYDALLDFADMIRWEISDKEVEQAAEGLKAAAGRALLAEYHGKEHPFAQGLSAYFPLNEVTFDKNYLNHSKFAMETGWDKLLQGYIAAAASGKRVPVLKITQVLPQPSNVSYPPAITYNVTGNNIVGIHRYIGKATGDEVVIQNGHELVLMDPTSERKWKYADWPDINELDYIWFPMTDVLTNGQVSILAPAFQFGENDYYFEVKGDYKTKDGTDPFPASLTFDYRTGKLISAKDLHGLVSEFKPQAGDIFTPRYAVIDMRTGEILRYIQRDKIALGDCGIWLDSCPLADGTYEIGLRAFDLSGNEDADWAAVNIFGQPAADKELSSQALLGKWTGYNPSYKNTTFNFGFSDEELSENEMISRFGLSIPSCNAWYRCDTTINTIGKPEKRPLGAYWYRNENGWPLLTILLLPMTGSEPISMVFLVEIQEDKLLLVDLYEGGRYNLTRQRAIDEAPTGIMGR